MASGCGIHIMTDPSCVSCRGGQWADAVKHAHGPKDPFSAMGGLGREMAAQDAAMGKAVANFVKGGMAGQAAIAAALGPFLWIFVFGIIGFFLIAALVVAVAGIAQRAIEATVYASMLAWAATLTTVLATAIFGPTVPHTRDGLIAAMPRLTKVGFAVGATVFLAAFMYFASEGVPHVSRDQIYNF